jgi:hypothetical protein
MPIYNQYKVTYTFPDKEPIQKIFNSRKETCDALSISLTILNKLINKSYDAKLKPHLDSKYLSIDRIETERAYLTPKQPKISKKERLKQKKLQDGFDLIEKSLKS